LWLVVDGAYAKRPFLRPAKALGLVVFGRLRKDADLRNVPTYGKERIDLAKRAAQKRGWQRVACVQYGERVVKTIKQVFLAEVLARLGDGGWASFTEQVVRVLARALTGRALRRLTLRREVRVGLSNRVGYKNGPADRADRKWDLRLHGKQPRNDPVRRAPSHSAFSFRLLSQGSATPADKF
jgi:hypothetical protein